MQQLRLASRKDRVCIACFSIGRRVNKFGFFYFESWSASYSLSHSLVSAVFHEFTKRGLFGNVSFKERMNTLGALRGSHTSPKLMIHIYRDPRSALKKFSKPFVGTRARAIVVQIHVPLLNRTPKILLERTSLFAARPHYFIGSL